MLSSLVETCVVAVSGEHFKPGSKSPDQEAATGQHEESLSETVIVELRHLKAHASVRMVSVPIYLAKLSFIPHFTCQRTLSAFLYYLIIS